MPVYEYKALDHKGKTKKGIIDAESETAARSKLRSAGKYPVKVTESAASSGKSKGGGASGQSIFERVKSEEIQAITRQLATLLGASIPLITALNSLVDQTDNPALKRAIARIRESVNEGSTLTNALAEHPKLFSNVYINMVRAGEASGSLDIVLERLADFGEKQEALKGQVKAALIYPLFMAFIGGGILLILITYIVPNITQVFTDMERALPLPTMLLIQLSDFLRSYWWLVGILGGLLFVGSRFLLQTSRGKLVADLIVLRAPIIGSVSQKIVLARFASTLGSLLGSGVGLIPSMVIVKSIVNNSQIGEVLDDAVEQIRKGKSMSSSLAASRWFPSMFVQMIAVGEQSGDLEPMLDKIAKSYERESETAIMGMTSLIEPVMIAGMGLTVGFVVLSVLLPIFEMNSMVG